MTKNKILDLINNHPIFHLATCDGNIPRVRHMLLFRADENGIIFHTSFNKEVCQQILENNNVELCFFDLKTFSQIRVEGKAIVVHDDALVQEILEEPNFHYLKRLKDMGNEQDFYANFVIFRLIQAKAHLWTIQNNYNEMKNYNKEYIILN